jgi:hypothetical protein
MPKPNHVIKNAVDHLDRLNREYPHLCSDFTEKTVDKLRAMFENIEQGPIIKTPSELPEVIEQDSPNNDIDFTQTTASNEAAELSPEIIESVFKKMSIDDALSKLKSDYPHINSIEDLLATAKAGFYIRALRREALEFQTNQISISQIAELWTDMGRPVLGSDRWTERSVSMVLG